MNKSRSIQYSCRESIGKPKSSGGELERKLESFDQDGGSRSSNGRRKEGTPGSAIQGGEIQTRVDVAAHGTSRSTVGELGEGRCSNGKIPSLPSDSIGSEEQKVDAFQHLAPFLQHLWLRKANSRSSYRGGWCSTPQRCDDLKSSVSNFWHHLPRIVLGVARRLRVALARDILGPS